MTADPQCEKPIRQLCEAGQIEEAASCIFAAYNREIYGFVLTYVREHDEAQDVMSMFAEDMWRGLPGFRWQCSARVWCYAIARNAALQRLRSAKRRHSREIPHTLADLVAHVRTVTEIYRCTAVKSRVRALRDRLTPEDQVLLTLRIDRGLSFRDVALATLGDPDVASTTLDREIARLRKAFERAKVELRKLAESEGLLPPHDG